MTLFDGYQRACVSSRLFERIRNSFAMNFLFNLTALAAHTAKLPVHSFQVPQVQAVMAQTGFQRALFEKNVNVDQTEYTPLMGFVDEKEKLFEGSGILLAVAIVIDLLCIVAFILYLKPCFRPLLSRNTIQSSLCDESL